VHPVQVQGGDRQTIAALLRCVLCWAGRDHVERVGRKVDVRIPGAASGQLRPSRLLVLGFGLRVQGSGFRF